MLFYYVTVGHCCTRATACSKLRTEADTESRKLEGGNWKPETGNWKLKAGNWDQAEVARLTSLSGAVADAGWELLSSNVTASASDEARRGASSSTRRTSSSENAPTRSRYSASTATSVLPSTRGIARHDRRPGKRSRDPAPRSSDGSALSAGVRLTATHPATPVPVARLTARSAGACAPDT